MTDPYREASKYNTAVRREVKRYTDLADKRRAEHLSTLEQLKAELSPGARRIVDAAEMSPEIDLPSPSVAPAAPPLAPTYPATNAEGERVDAPLPEWAHTPPSGAPALVVEDFEERKVGPARRGRG